MWGEHYRPENATTTMQLFYLLVMSQVANAGSVQTLSRQISIDKTKHCSLQAHSFGHCVTTWFGV